MNFTEIFGPWLLGLSILLQFLAAFIALRLIKITQLKWAWAMISSAVFLMGIRRSVTFYRLQTSVDDHTFDLSAEMIALTISLLMVFGLIGIGPLFRELSNANKKLLKSKRSLDLSRKLLQSVLDTVPVRVFWKDKNSNYLGCNIHAAHDAGLKNTKEIVGKNDFQLNWSAQAELYQTDDQTVMETNQPKIGYEEQQSHPDGSLIWLRTNKVPLLNEKGEIYGVLGTYEDITERKRLEEEEKILFQLLELSFEPMDVFMEKSIIVITSIPWLGLEDKGGIFLIRNNLEQKELHLACSYNLNPELIKEFETFSCLACAGENSDKSKKDQFIACINCIKWDSYFKERPLFSQEIYNIPLLHGDQLFGIILLICKQEHIKQNFEVKFLERVSNILGLGISNHLAESQVKHQAFHDQLTGLPNRYLLLDRLQQSYTWSWRYKIKDALIYIDMDRFKHINDSLGHAIGDLLLKKVAQRLKISLRNEDTLARLGGDEFVILIKEIAVEKDKAICEVRKIVEKLQSSFNKTFRIDDQEIFVTLSCGIAIIPDDGKNGNELLKHADTAMYQAKHHGRNTYTFFSEDMQKKSDERRNLEVDLRQAIKNNEFIVYYQPQVNQSNQIIGAEALLHWNHPKLGKVSPNTFIPIAEDCGLILEIGAWVLNAACKQYKIFRQSDPLGYMGHISVNISAQQFHNDNFFQHVETAITHNEIQASQLILELTESIMVTNTDDTVNKMHKLKELGVCFSIDDFGTGYSSLNYLKKLPLDQLKIDKSIIDDIDNDPNDKIIIETIISMSRHFNLDLIAEGVENENQLNYLQKAGCLNIQGFLFSKPLLADKFTELLVHQANFGNLKH